MAADTPARDALDDLAAVIAHETAVGLVDVEDVVTWLRENPQAFVAAVGRDELLRLIGGEPNGWEFDHWTDPPRHWVRWRFPRSGESDQ